jgi:putative oxidoreductase
MTASAPDRYRSFAHVAIRIAVGMTYFSHGAAKLFGWFGGMGPDGGTVELMSRFGAAGIIETTCGLLIVLGFFARPAAFIASGEMAVAYFWMHWAGSGKVWWWQNRGELVMIYSFVWLFIAAWGSGPFSLDAWLASRRSGAS